MHLIIVYIVFFIGIFLEGEFILLSAVIAAHQGILNIWLVIPIAIFATISSDIVYFNLGKHKAEKWLSKSKFASKFETVNQRLRNHRTKMLLSYRFLYGIRMITPFVLGTQKLEFTKFLKYSIISTVIWCLILVGLGYAFGELIINNLKHIEKIEYYFIISLLVIAVFYIIYKFIDNNKDLHKRKSS
jgi:membrane protein DedA with SNARE-associated domain